MFVSQPRVPAQRGHPDAGHLRGDAQGDGCLWRSDRYAVPLFALGDPLAQRPQCTALVEGAGSSYMALSLTNNCGGRAVNRIKVWRKGVDAELFHPRFSSAVWRNKLRYGFTHAASKPSRARFPGRT